MVEYSKYGRERLPSEQVEKLRNSFAHGLVTRTPEPRAASGTPQPVTNGSLQPELPKRKQKCNNINALGESEPHNTSLEPESDVVVETPQSKRPGPSLSAPPTRKRKRTTDFLSEHKSPELESASESETHSPITRGSSQPPSQKRKRKSKMVRELEAHNESPEQSSEPDIEMLRESTKKPLTRSKARKVVSFLKDRTPTPPKNLNFKRLMSVELSGTPKGTKTWYFQNDSNRGSSSHQRQPESRQSIDVIIKEEEEEGSLWGNIRTSGRSRTMSQQPRKSSEISKRNQAAVVESAWSRWDREKGESSFNTALTAPLL